MNHFNQLFRYLKHELLNYAIHEKFKSKSEQFKSMHGKCHISARVSIPATTLHTNIFTFFTFNFDLVKNSFNFISTKSLLLKHKIWKLKIPNYETDFYRYSPTHKNLFYAFHLILYIDIMSAQLLAQYNM